MIKIIGCLLALGLLFSPRAFAESALKQII